LAGRGLNGNLVWSYLGHDPGRDVLPLRHVLGLLRERSRRSPLVLLRVLVGQIPLLVCLDLGLLSLRLLLLRDPLILLQLLLVRADLGLRPVALLGLVHRVFLRVIGPLQFLLRGLLR
jgi:hypothetical protein